MTLGESQTPLADGVFDPVSDQVTSQDGRGITNYFLDTLKVPFYQPLDKTRFPLPPSGWCTWYYYYNRITADEVKRNTDWIAANLKDFGAQYVEIDDGWQGLGGGDGGRDWSHVNPDRFPQGMAELAAYIKAATELGLPANQPVHVFDFWNAAYLGAWRGGFSVAAAPTSCRVLTLLPCQDRIQLVSTSRHITQGWLDLFDTSASASGTKQKGTSRVVWDDPYEIRFAFPPGTNFALAVATARGPAGKLPVRISNHQQWAAFSFTSPQSGDVQWKAQFEPAPNYHFPSSPPEGLWVERVGLDGANLHWREQYYLNNGYEVSLNGSLAAHASQAQFPLRGLDPSNSCTAQIRSTSEDGQASPRAAEIKFTLASLLPDELSLTELEPTSSDGRWRGFEADETLSGAPLTVHGRHYRGLFSFSNSEAEYDLKGMFRVFFSAIGVDGDSRNDAMLEFIVLGDGKELWRNSRIMPGQDPTPIHLDVTGVRTLTLQVKGPEHRSRLQADWVEPKLERQP